MQKYTKKRRCFAKFELTNNAIIIMKLQILSNMSRRAQKKEAFMMKEELEARKWLLLKLYFDKYDTFVLTRTQVARILDKSESTIDRWKKNGKGPAFQKDESSKNGSVTYMIDSVIDFLLSNPEFKTINQE